LVPDEGDRATARAIVAWRAERRSWYQIARTLLLSGMTTPDGREWTTSRCRRVFDALTSGKIAATDRLVPLGLAAARADAKRRELATKQRRRENDIIAICKLMVRAARMTG
jgi:hypothetical protein